MNIETELEKTTSDEDLRKEENDQEEVKNQELLAWARSING